MEIEFTHKGLWQLAEVCGAAAPDVNVYVDVSGIEAQLEAIQGVAKETNKLLVDLNEALRNPRSMESEELYRRGVLAFEHGWMDDAQREIEASIAAFPYRPAAQLLLGAICAAVDDPVRADAAFSAAIKYGSASEVQFACEAAIIGARLRVAAGAERSGVNMLENAIETLPHSIWIVAERATIEGQIPRIPMEQPKDMYQALLESGVIRNSFVGIGVCPISVSAEAERQARLRYPSSTDPRPHESQ